MINIAICDDNNSICTHIEKIILEYEKRTSIPFDISVFYSGEALVNHIKNDHHIDLLFLDIELGTMSGIEVGGILRDKLDNHLIKIVFITAATGYEPQLFDLQPFNFIKKPIFAPKVNKCLDLYIKLNMEITYFVYKKDYTVTKIPVNEILYFEKDGKKICVKTTKGADYFNESLSSIQKKLPETFVKPHGSFLINFEKIISLQPDNLTMVDNTTIPVSRRQLQILRQMLLHTERNSS
ncbi:MAG: hypothetical protein ATN36_06155 [Epulopiscium sp. Nele67-Bin005]|nr:MAG: hypothetical protein ATN36_06155 [Epulopiscium sp. Nele67-Bin005]